MSQIACYLYYKRPLWATFRIATAFGLSANKKMQMCKSEYCEKYLIMISEMPQVTINNKICEMVNINL